MNILYILGNGFDKAQGLKTSYPEFYQYLTDNASTCSPLLQKMIEEIKSDKELWSDMEEAFGQFTSKIKDATALENLYFELCDKLQEYLKAEDKKFNPTDNLRNKFLKDITIPLSFLEGEADKRQCMSFAHNPRNPTQAHSFHIMTLNYTKTLEKILDTPKIQHDITEIIHVHGLLDDSIILGVDNEEQIANEQFRNNDDVKDFLVKEQSNNAMKVTRHFDCKHIIEGANLIILYGVSLGKTDERWWKLIGEQLEKRLNLCIIQHIYAPDTIIQRTRKQLLGRIERKQRKILMDKFGIHSNIENIENRLFFITNSNAFKI